MTNHTGLSPQSPIKYLGPNVYLAVVVTRNREPTGADYRQPETGKLYPFNTFWLVGKNPTTGVFGDVWYLSKIVSNVAFWIKLSAGGGGPLINVQVQTPIAPGVNPVAPTGLGLITFNGAVVTNAGIPVQSVTRALNTFNLEVQYAGSAAVATPTSSGLAHFNSAQFTVGATGFVSLLGTGTLSSLTGDDLLAATPTAGNINLVGAIVASGTHALRPLFFRRSATSTETLDLQLSIASATSVATNVGVSSFDSVAFSVDTNGFVKSKSGNQPGVSNLGIAYAAPTFTVQGSDGTALSATNPAYLTLQDGTTPGRLITVAVTANQTFTDGAAGNIDTWRGGVSPTDQQGGVSSNWAQDMPFFLYGILGTTNDIMFAFSRDPRASTSPAAGNLSKTGTINNVSQFDMFLFGGAGITLANYASRPCLCVGSFRMRNVVNAGTIRYTVQALNSFDGIGQYQENVLFSFPTGVNGAVAGRYWSSAGTTPTFTTMNSKYQILRSGRVFYNVKQENVNNAGSLAGAVQLQIALPYANGSVVEGYNNWFTYTAQGTSTLFTIMAAVAQNASVTSAISFFQLSGTPGGLVPTSFQVDDSFEGQAIYNAFI